MVPFFFVKKVLDKSLFWEYAERLPRVCGNLYDIERNVKESLTIKYKYMVNTIRAFKSVFNLMLVIVQLIIGLTFLLKIFSQDIIFDLGLSDFAETISEQITFENKSSFESNSPDSHVTALVFILAYMLFSFVLFSQVPRIMNQSRKTRLFKED